METICKSRNIYSPVAGSCFVDIQDRYTFLSFHLSFFLCLSLFVITFSCFLFFSTSLCLSQFSSISLFFLPLSFFLSLAPSHLHTHTLSLSLSLSLSLLVMIDYILFICHGSGVISIKKHIFIFIFQIIVVTL